MPRTRRPAIPSKTPDQLQLEQLGLTPDMASMYTQSFRKGGTVKRTGVYKLHRGEKVVPAKPARKRRK
jgi:hypothetical protein